MAAREAEDALKNFEAIVDAARRESAAKDASAEKNASSDKDDQKTTASTETPKPADQQDRKVATAETTSPSFRQLVRRKERHARR